MNNQRLLPRPRWAFGDCISILFPHRCPLCDGVLPLYPRYKAPLPEKDKADVWTHPSCYARLRGVSEPFCLCCGIPLAREKALCRRCEAGGFTFKQNLPLWPYDDIVRESLSRFKYHGRQQYAVYYARAWYSQYRDYLSFIRPDALIPVPIHAGRLRTRGYNQAALLAAELEKLSGIPLRDDLLLRVKHTGAQKELGAEARLANMQNAFRLKKKAEGLKRVLLIDDIFTTGSTLESISRLLAGAGVAEIYTASVAIVEKV